MTDPQVVVVVPCFNAARFLYRTLESVMLQTFQDWRLIVVDDGSTDASGAVAQAAAAMDARVHVLRTANRGVATARNAGVTRGDSPFLLFLDADDVLEPTMLDCLVSELEENPEDAAAYCGHSYIDEADRSLGEERGDWTWIRLVPTRFGIRDLRRTEVSTPFCSIFLVAAMLPSLCLIRRQHYLLAGGWDESFGQGCEDTDLFLRLRLRGDIRYVPSALVRYRRHPSQWTATSDFAAQYDKLTTKWRNLQLPEDQRRVVDHAFWFRNHRFYPHRNLVHAKRHAGRREWWPAASSVFHAVTAYRPGRPPATTTASLGG